jgi:hypothetical protein
MAIGSLVGDAVIHIIPDIFHEQNDIPEKERSNPHITSLLIVTGFIVFFTIEKVFMLSGIAHMHGMEEECDGDEHKVIKKENGQENKNIHEYGNFHSDIPPDYNNKISYGKG